MSKSVQVLANEWLLAETGKKSEGPFPVSLSIPIAYQVVLGGAKVKMKGPNDRCIFTPEKIKRRKPKEKSWRPR